MIFTIDNIPFEIKIKEIEDEQKVGEILDYIVKHEYEFREIHKLLCQETSALILKDKVKKCATNYKNSNLNTKILIGETLAGDLNIKNGRCK